MRKSVVLITGAGGEIGHGLISRLAENGSSSVVTLDLNPLEPAQARMVQREFNGSITDARLLDRILSEFEISTVFHLAALLSTRSEFTPVTAHQVNVEGTLNLLEFAQREAESHGRPVTFLYPSSIAAYGLPDLDTKHRAGRVKEDEFNTPTTMYGCNKLYCEQLGRYYARFYKQLAAETQSGRVDFRAVRFPGLISALTVPSGGTSDYAPEMIHAAANGESYACFVRPDTRIPFMAMPDGVDALVTLAAADRNRLTRTAYNLGAFNPSAEEISTEVLRAFPDAMITWKVDIKRQGIVDSWPADVDDSLARRDWGFAPQYDFRTAFRDYLIPTIKQRYTKGTKGTKDAKGSTKDTKGTKDAKGSTKDTKGTKDANGAKGR
jgi:nucleoside-diphosphate-sugar epimerase